MSKLRRRQPLGTRDNPVWRLYECERGARWASAMNAAPMDRPYSCNFSGPVCGESYHACRIVRETMDKEEAGNWFRYPKGDVGV